MISVSLSESELQKLCLGFMEENNKGECEEIFHFYGELWEKIGKEEFGGQDRYVYVSERIFSYHKLHFWTPLLSGCVRLFIHIGKMTFFKEGFLVINGAQV